MPMHTEDTLKLSVIREDGAAGIDFYWTFGAHVVLIQHWFEMSFGRFYGPVEPDPMSQDNLLDYFLECWQDKEGIHFTVGDVEIFN